jgi:hypothetical protein
MRPKSFTEKIDWLWWFLPMLALSALSTLNPELLKSPVIFNDDWCYIISSYVYGPLNLVDWGSRRPLTLTLYAAVLGLGGLKLQIFYLLNFIITLASSVLFYFLIRRAFPKYAWLALPAALVYLVYPVDATRTWMVTIYIHFVQLITFGVIYLFVDYAGKGGAWRMILAWIGFLLTLGAYEGQFGLVVGAAVVMVFSNRSLAVKRKAVLSSIFLAGILFLAWRLWIQPQWLNIHDNYFQEVQLSPVILIYRFYLAVKVFTVDWAEPLAFYLGISQPLLVFLSYGAGLAAALAVYLLYPGQRSKTVEPMTWAQRDSLLKGLLVTAALGAFFWAAGFIPGLVIFTPTWAGVASRGNNFAIAGASLLLVSLVTYAVLLAARSLGQVRAMTLAAVIPFILLGTLAQVWVHVENRSAWEEQKQLWNGIFTVLPGLKDGTTMMVVFPGYDQLRPLQRLPLASQWEANCAAIVLYHNTSLQARFYYRDFSIPQPVLLNLGVQDWDNEVIIPYEQTVFVYFDPADRSVRVIDRIGDVVSLPFSIEGYAPQDRITSRFPTSLDYRFLVK